MTTALTRRATFSLIGGALAAPALVRSAKAAEVTLRLHHFLPAVSGMHRFVFEPWAKEIAEASGGAIEIQIFPSMQLGGKPPQLADQAKSGIADISWTLPVYTPDRFILAETMALPFMVTDAVSSSIAMHKVMEEFDGAKEYRGTRALAYHVHEGGKFHMRERPILSTADLQGSRVRAPNQATGELLTALGADPVFFPVTEMVVGLSNGVIDGCCLPYEVVPPFKLQELTSQHSAPPAGGRGLYTNTFAVLMNERRYRSMPKELQKVMDDHSGMEFSKRIGEFFAESERVGLEVVKKQGNHIHEIPASVIAEWREASAPAHEAWKKKLDGAGYDADAVLNRINALLDGTAS